MGRTSRTLYTADAAERAPAPQIPAVYCGSTHPGGATWHYVCLAAPDHEDELCRAGVRGEVTWRKGESVPKPAKAKPKGKGKAAWK